ncbi:StbB family protein [Variovorax sp. M-6]|uniref:StbB family protein n=1 Tax=Variovorax sp. M-6 TaxID=3233041 RepID=UPI003F9B69A2
MTKLCILNLSGNVGKSTLAVHLLAAFKPGAKIVSVETINASNADSVDGVEVEEIAVSRFKDILRELMRNDEVIIDVGASNVAAFMSEMKRFKSAVGEFDLILVPTVPTDKQQRDTIATIEWLTSLGVDAKKIRVVFNLFAPSEVHAIEMVYSQVIGYSLTEGATKAVYKPYAVVEANEIYELVKRTKKTISELANDATDWPERRKAAQKAGDMDALEAAIEAQMEHDLAETAQLNLAQVNALLFGKGRKA